MLRQWWVSWGGVGVMVTFLDVARMVDATAMMGVLGCGGGDGNLPWWSWWWWWWWWWWSMMMMMMMMIHDDDDDDDVKKVVFWNHDDAFSHATLAKSSFCYSGMLIFCPYNVHFLHGRETVGNPVVIKLGYFPSTTVKAGDARFENESLRVGGGEHPNQGTDFVRLALPFLLVFCQVLLRKKRQVTTQGLPVLPPKRLAFGWRL